MDRLDAMTVFIAAVDGGSLSAGGRQLGMPLATVSRKLSDLETHLRVRLLHRSTRKLTLTDAGRDYYASCKRILEDVGEAERDASGEYSEPRGELVIAAPIVFGRLHVLPVVSQFLAAYPEVDVRLVQGDRNANLVEDHLDLAVRIGALPDSSMTAANVGSVRRVVCASPDYLSRRGTPKAPEDLSAHACVSFDALGSADAWRFQREGEDRVVTVHPRLVVNTAEAAIDAAIAGVGISRILSYQVADAIRAGTLHRLLQEHESVSSPVSLLFDGRRRLPLKLRAFVDFATPRLRERLAHAG
jgi:DNA-binding transcriptional LysR family regulator